MTALRTVYSWHRPLFVLAAAMAVLAAVGVGGMLIDDRELTGLPIWDKPTKFALSILVYALTWAWLIAQLRTDFDATLWRIMGVSIVLVWFASLYVAAQLFRGGKANGRDGDPARTPAIRAGAVLALVGMAVAFLMTVPTAAQIAEGGTFSGAHTVGPADGGPGLPLLGWSTVGGDLRIPHFVGMHALQALPLLLLALELAAPRVATLGSAAVRLRLVVVAALGYAGMLAVLTWQALRGQPVVAPDTLTLDVAAALLAAVAGGVAWAVRTPQEPPVALTRIAVPAPARGR